jgi:hypothetical protein
MEAVDRGIEIAKTMPAEQIDAEYRSEQALTIALVGRWRKRA